MNVSTLFAQSILILAATASAIAGADDPSAETMQKPELLPFKDQVIIDRVLAKEKQWLGVDALDGDGLAARLADAWRASVNDPSGLLSDGEWSQFLKLIARHAEVRTFESPEPYEWLSEKDLQHRWASSNDFLGQCTVNCAWQNVFNEPFPEVDNIKSLLDSFWQEVMVKRGHRFARIGVGTFGARFDVERVTDPTQSRINEGFPEDESAWDKAASPWIVSGRFPASTFRLPIADRSPLESVLLTEKSALVIHAHIIVTLVNGAAVDWYTAWVHDPRSGQWTIQATSPWTHRVVYIIQ